MVTVVNTTFTFILNSDLDLLAMARQLWDVEYNPRKFSSLVMRLREPRSTAMISKSGYVVLLGCQTWDDARKASKRVERRVRRVVSGVKVTDLTLKNMVGAGKHDFNVRDYLNTVTRSTFYDYEIFPGINVDLTCGLKATVFNKGTFFITGAKSETELEAGHLELMIKFYFN